MIIRGDILFRGRWTVYTVCILLFCGSFGMACNKSGNDDSVEVGEDVSREESTVLKDLSVFPGRNRLKFEWAIPEIQVKEVRIKWENHVEKISVPSGSDSVCIILDELEEGNHIFTIEMFGDKGQVIESKKVTKYVYGDKFEKSLLPRPIGDILLVNGIFEMNWKSSAAEMLESVLSYKDSLGKEQNLLIEKKEDRTVLEGFKVGGSIHYQTLYVPEENALDTFVSQKKEIPIKDYSNMSIKWDENTLSTLATPGGYCRIIELEQGDLLAAYEVQGEIAVITSKDGGKTWSDRKIIVRKEEGYNMTTPSLIQLKDKSVLVAYSPRPINGDKANADPTKFYSIRTIRSLNNGQTWEDDKMLFQAGSTNRLGCWEPAMVQLPNGEIQLFFSNESTYLNSNEQNISLLRSNDYGSTWTKNPEIVSFRPGARDGMPVPLVLPETEEVLFSIEDNGGVDFKPYIIRNSFQENWNAAVGANSVNREYALVRRLPGSVYAGAPYLVRLTNGLTALSFQSTENRGQEWDLSCMNVAVGDSTGRNFKNVTVPFDIPLDKYGLWNSLCVMKDGTILAISATNGYNDRNRNEVNMIKGNLKFLID